ncbi:MAG: lipocalin-like domain-containing protein [Bacteroidales bacterium]|nr:lipocalin-like domain-containing protein [Bacteroidales bacterium]
MIQIKYPEIMKMARMPFLLLFVFAAFASCAKMDDNGDLGGQWQLTEWRDKATGEIKATNETGIYYAFQLDLMQFRRIDKGYYYLARFYNRGDSLLLGDIYSWGKELAETEEGVGNGTMEKKAAPAELTEDFGVSPDGKFAIETLNSSTLVLSNGQALLKFRKY